MDKPKVLNQSRPRPYDGSAVYVGRPSPWGNPFIIGEDGNRAEVIEKYRNYILSNQYLLSQLHKLRGKNLICWCAPAPCHADVLLELANKESDG